jgi:CspA family cold shock protein
MATGVVKFFNNNKGFGFIVDDGTGKEIFVHVTGVQEEIRENDRVTYDIEEGKKGPNAVRVRLA